MKYVVRAITQKYEDIELTVTKSIPQEKPKVEEQNRQEEEPDPLTIIVPETDEERLLLNLVKGFRRFGYDPFPRSVKPQLMHFAYPMVESKINLTIKEYDDIGKPGIGQTLEITIKKVD